MVEMRMIYWICIVGRDEDILLDMYLCSFRRDIIINEVISNKVGVIFLKY